MTEAPSPKAFAKNLIAIYKGDTKRAAEAVRTSRPSADPFWADVLTAIASAEAAS